MACKWFRIDAKMRFATQTLFTRALNKDGARTFACARYGSRVGRAAKIQCVGTDEDLKTYSIRGKLMGLITVDVKECFINDEHAKIAMFNRYGAAAFGFNYVSI